MTKLLIRDFIYLDVERVRSFVAQTSGGLTSERTHQNQHQVGGEGQVEGGIPLIAKATGSTDYHYLRSHSETKIVDYQSTMATLQGLPTLLDVVGKITSIQKETATQPNQNRQKGQGQTKVSANSQPNNPELQQLKNQMKYMPLKEVASFVNQMYGDVIRIKVFPFQNALEKVFVGSADRSLFRYSPTSLANLYGSVIDADWISILQVNKGVHHEPGQMVSTTGNDMEDGLEQMADYFSSLATIAQGVKYPAVAVTPIAIYREIAESRSLAVL